MKQLGLRSEAWGLRGTPLISIGLDVTPFHPAQIFLTLINVHLVSCKHFSLR